MVTQLPQKKDTLHETFGHDYCGQTTGWIKMPLGVEVNLGPGDVVLVKIDIKSASGSLTLDGPIGPHSRLRYLRSKQTASVVLQFICLLTVDCCFLLSV